MNTEEILHSISNKYRDDYSEDKLENLRQILDKMLPGIKKSLENFLQTGEKQEINLLGYSLDKLMREHSMNEVAAHATLDWLMREPDQALASLRKGHDFVEFSNG